MSSLPRVTYPGRQAWVGLLVSGVAFWVRAALLWVLFLGGSLALLWVSSARFSPASHLSSRGLSDLFWHLWLVGGAACVTFLAALLSARSRWIYRPGWSSFLAYALVLVVGVIATLWSRADTSRHVAMSFWDVLDLTALAVPLAAAPFGGWLGSRWFGVA